MLSIVLEIRYCAFKQYMAWPFSNNVKSGLTMLISTCFQKRPISKMHSFMVTLFDLGLTLTARLGNSTTGLIVTGRCRAFQLCNSWVCVWWGGGAFKSIC